MNGSIFVTAWLILMTMAAIWFPTLFWFFRRLRIQHPSVYESIGSPSLFWNNSMRNNWLFFKFLWSSRVKELNDLALTRSAVFMRIWLVIYTALFVACLVAFAIVQP